MSCSDGSEITWAYLGPLRLCPPFLYGARVVPSPCFFTSGMGGQNVLVRGHDRFATTQAQVCNTRQPDAQTLAEWALYPVRAYQMHSKPNGGWAPHRSQLVSWGGLARRRTKRPWIRATQISTG